MGVKHYRVSSKVSYTVTEYDSQRITISDVKIDDKGEPFTKDELEDILAEEVFDEFDKIYGGDNPQIEELYWDEIV